MNQKIERDENHILDNINKEKEEKKDLCLSFNNRINNEKDVLKNIQKGPKLLKI